MSNYTGYTIEPILRDSLRWASASIVNAPVILAVMGVDEPTALASHSRSAVIPAMLAYDRAMSKVPSFLDDYYYRMHISPATIVLGALLSEVKTSVMVWNAWFTPQTCSVIQAINDSNAVLDGLTPPFALKALEHTTYVVTALLVGDPQFETIYTFDFGEGGLPVLVITGTRLTLFPWRPQMPLQEALEWRTDVLTARDGSEQRMALRSMPRQMFSSRVLIDGVYIARWESLLWMWGKRMWGLPIWPELVEHEATIEAGVESIEIDTTYADFRPGALAVIWQSPTQNEVVKIESVESGSLALVSPVAGTYVGTKTICPVRIAYMPSKPRRRDYSSGLFECECEFAVTDNTDIQGFSAPTTYKGVPVLTDPTYIDPTQTKTTDADIAVTDFETGDIDILSDNPYNIDVQSHRFEQDSKAASWAFRQFLHSLRGKQGTVWIPSFNADMVLTDTIGSTEATFSIENHGIARNMGFNGMRTHVAFRFPDGSMLFREIVGMTEVDEDTDIVTIDAALGIEVEPGDCEISFLDLCRLDTDRVEINWLRAHEQQCEVNFRRVKG